MLEHKKIHTEEKPYWYNQCGKVFRKNSTLINNKECIKERSPITAVNMENLSDIQPLLDIWRLTVKTNLTDVMTVENSIGRAQFLLDIREQYQENKINVERLFPQSSALKQHRKFITKKESWNVVKVVNHTEVVYSFWALREDIQ